MKARRVYVGNLPQGIGLQPKVLQEFFNTALVSAGLVVGEGVPINDVWISSEGRYAFLEMRSPQEATNAMKLDGISLSVVACGNLIRFLHAFAFDLSSYSSNLLPQVRSSSQGFKASRLCSTH